MSCEMIAIEKTLADERFCSAMVCVQGKRFNEAIEQFSQLMGDMVEEHGDLGPAMVPVYYEYGRACLLQAESTSNVFGASVKNKNAQEEEEVIEEDVQDSADDTAEEALQLLIEEFKKQTGKDPTDEVLQSWRETLMEASLGAIGQNDEDEKHAESNASTGNGPAALEIASEVIEETETVQENAELTSEDIEELMAISWECLEAARVILAKLAETISSETEVRTLREWFCKVYLRLGDLGMERGLFQQSIEDYSCCLAYTKQIAKVWDNNMADVFTHLATSYVFASTETPGVAEMRESQIHAMQNYIFAIHSLASNRNHILKLDIQDAPCFDTVSVDDDEDEGKGKKKKVAEEIEDLPPLTSVEKLRILNAKAALESILQTSVSNNDTETDETREILEIIEEMKNKVDDMILVLENPEASRAITGAAAAIVEDEIEANNTSSGFDAPTTVESTGPTNLLQARKKAELPVGEIQGLNDEKVVVNSTVVKRKQPVVQNVEKKPKISN